MSRLAHWIAFVLSLAAVLAVAVALQAFSDLYNGRVDLTATQALSLSPYTLSVLGEVKKPLQVELYYERGKRQSSRDMLELLHDHCPSLTYELVDLDRNPARAKEHRVDHYDRAVLRYDGREVVVFAGNEESLTGGIARILAEHARVLYFLDGHQERSLGAGGGENWARVVQVLRNEGYETRPLSLLQAADVPSDASAVVLAGPETDLAEGELRALTSYLERGGSVLVAVDPLVLPRLEAWVATYGFALGDDVVIDRANRVYGSDGTNVVVPYYRDHAAVRGMVAPSVLGRARSVDIVAGREDDVTSGPSIVARTAPESFAARDASRTRAGEVTFDEQRDRQGPIGIMAVTLVAPESDKPGRLALIGDADFASDAFFSLLGNKNLLVNVLGWLVPTGAGGARPQTAATQLGPMSPMYVSDQLAQTIFLVAVVAQPAVVLLIGIAVVIGRRRRR